MKPYRFYSVMRNVGWVAAILLGCAALAMVLVLMGPLAPIAAFTMMAVLFLAIFGLPIAVLAGLIWPYCLDEPPSQGKRQFAWGFGSVGALMILLLAWCGAYVGKSMLDGRPSEGDYATFSDLRRQRIANVFHIEKLIPPTATEIHFRGSGGMTPLPLGKVCRFQCKVTEADFRAFAVAQGYPLATNVFRNANVKDSEAESGSAEISLDSLSGCLFKNPADIPKIDNYLSYWYQYSNFGGPILLYDLDKQILYGSYSSN